MSEAKKLKLTGKKVVVPLRPEKLDRKTVLLKAAYDLLVKQTTAPYVLNLLEETVFYDGADCDGSCLMEDIATELNLEHDER